MHGLPACLFKYSAAKGEVGGHALNSHGNYIVDHGKSWNCVFEFLWEPLENTIGLKMVLNKMLVISAGIHKMHVRNSKQGIP